jgi:hypothetical protein
MSIPNFCRGCLNRLDGGRGYCEDCRLKRRGGMYGGATRSDVAKFRPGSLVTTNVDKNVG